MNYTLRKATEAEIPEIWIILQQAIALRKADGSTQWQDGYPNEDVIRNDIKTGVGFVLVDESEILGYVAVIINNEPEYLNIEGKWLSNGDFIVCHRIALAKEYLGKGLTRIMLGLIEDFARTKKILSVRADTNFDNIAMLTILRKSGYSHCGQVYFRGSAREAFEKLL